MNKRNLQLGGAEEYENSYQEYETLRKFPDSETPFPRLCNEAVAEHLRRRAHSEASKLSYEAYGSLKDGSEKTLIDPEMVRMDVLGKPAYALEIAAAENALRILEQTREELEMIELDEVLGETFGGGHSNGVVNVPDFVREISGQYSRLEEELIEEDKELIEEDKIPITNEKLVEDSIKCPEGHRERLKMKFYLDYINRENMTLDALMRATIVQFMVKNEQWDVTSSKLEKYVVEELERNNVIVAFEEDVNGELVLNGGFEKEFDNAYLSVKSFVESGATLPELNFQNMAEYQVILTRMAMGQKEAKLKYRKSA